MEFEISYKNKEITPWGGMGVLKQMLEKLEFWGTVLKNSDIPRPGSNCGKDPATIIESFITSIWCGANRVMHTEVTRHDVAPGKSFGWKRTSEHVVGEQRSEFSRRHIFETEQPDGRSGATRQRILSVRDARLS